MKILNLQAANFMKITAVEITPKGNMVEISGRNAQGKSAILDAIKFAFEGKRALKDIPEPVHTGAEKAEVLVETETYLIKRRISTDDKMTIAVEGKDGSVYKRPQELLDKLYGDISFDPEEFLRMDDKEQYNTVLKLADLPIDPATIDAQIAGIYAQRTEIGRDVKKADGHAQSLKIFPDNTPDEEVLTSEILKQIEDANIINSKNEKERDAHVRIEAEYKQALKDMEDLNQKIKKAEDHAVECLSNLSASNAKITVLQDVNTDALYESLKSVESVNKAVTIKKTYLKALEDKAQAQQEYDNKTDEINNLVDQKMELLINAKLPIPGLLFRDGILIYNNVPLSQASASEKIRISMAIAMAKNPTLKVIHIRNGSLLDSQSSNIIQQIAINNDYQIWKEVVDETGKVGFFIEDGTVK